MSSTLAAQQKASLTAYDCAAARAAVAASSGNRSFDYLAEDLVVQGSASLRAKSLVRLVKLGLPGLARRLLSKAEPGVDVFMFARQTVSDDLIRQALSANPETQVVILGAGLDTSGLRIGSERSDTGQAPGTFFEVDLPVMQAEKRRLAAKLFRSHPGLADKHIIYVPCSFGENELEIALRSAGFNPVRPTVWVWSGVIPYLPEDAIRTTVADLRALSSAGSKLFFDFILLDAYEKPAEYGFNKIKAKFDAYGEVMSFGLRQGIEPVREWLSTQGLTFVRSYTPPDMVALYENKIGKPPPSGSVLWVNLCIAAF